MNGEVDKCFFLIKQEENEMDLVSIKVEPEDGKSDRQWKGEPGYH